MSSSKILFFLCISFIAGIFLESLTKIPQIFVWGILVLAIAIIFLFHKKYYFIAGFFILFFVLGILRVQISEFEIKNNKLAKLNGRGEVVLEGVISGEPDVRDTSQKLKVEVADGTILITTSRYPEYKYLEKLKITGKLETPSITDDFNYKDYLLKDGIYSVMSFPKLEKLDRGRASIFSYIYSGILEFKSKLRKSIEKNFLPPYSSILKGTILGDSGAMSADFKSKLNITGLRHIISVSGTHIIILSQILIYCLLALGFWRKQTIILSIVIVWVYIILTGLAPSGIRAGIMGTLLFLSQIFGRQNTSQRTITLAGALMLLQNPLLLIYDAGFQLSFLASLGIIYLNPILKNFLKYQIISTTFSAQIFTLPLMIYSFGNMSLVAPITNLLIAPVVEPLMIFGFISVFFGVFSNFLGFILSFPCQILLMYFNSIIELFSKPYMAIFFENKSWIWLVISYPIIFGLTWFLNKKTAARF